MLLRPPQPQPSTTHRTIFDCLAPHHDDSSNTCGKYLASNVFAHSRAFALLLVSAFTFPSSLLPFSIPTYSAI